MSTLAARLVARGSSAVLARYENESRGVRAHVKVRWRSCPFGAVAAHVPLAGRVLEVGCGHGLLSCLLAMSSPSRDVVGVDVDAGKIAAAQRAGTGLATFHRTASGELPDGEWDAIVIVDVLYLLSRDDQRKLLEDCVSRLAPGGRLLVKEMDTRPRWKALWGRVQETMAVRVFRITEGDHLVFTSPADFASWLEAVGLHVQRMPLDAGYVHPHHLLIAER